MQFGENIYTQLTDRQLSIEKRLDLIEQMGKTNSKQMIFDWLSGLVINRKKSGLDSIELVHRVWRQLISCLKDTENERIAIKSSFIKTLIETLGNANGESSNATIECCLFIGSQGKELDYKYEQLVELLLIVLMKYKEHEELLTMILNKYWTTVRVQGNINKVFLDLCKQLLGPLLNIRTIHPSLTSLIDDILKYILFHRTWITAYRDYIQSISTKKHVSSSVSPLFITLESLIISENPNVINFLPLVFRHCINLLDAEKVSEIFEFLMQINTWLEQMKNADLYIDGIRQILEILDEKHLIDQFLTDPFEERLTSWMKDILFKRTITHHAINYANLCVVCLHLHPKFIETNLSEILPLFLQSDDSCLSVFLIGYIDLYSRMRSLPKLTKRLTTVFDKSIILPSNVLEYYRTCISQCTHTLIDEIWSSLLENNTHHLIIIQLISALLDGYRLFDLNIPREILIQQSQLKYQRTLEKLRQQIDETFISSNSNHRICLLQCYLSLGWFSLCLLSFSSSIPPADDILNHNGSFLPQTQWTSWQSDINIQPILFSLACQRLYRSLAVNEHDIDEILIENILQLSSSSSSMFDSLEPFFDFLSKSKQLKLVKIFIQQILEYPQIDRSWFISNEDRLGLVVQAVIEMTIHEDSPVKKRRKIDFQDDPNSFYDYLNTKSCQIDGRILSIFSSINFPRIQSMGILISIAWLALKTSPSSFQSLQILVEIISSSKLLPNSLITNLLDFTLAQNNDKMLDQILTIFSSNSEYQKILKRKGNQIIEEMKSNEDSLNIRLLEKYLLLFSYHHHSDELTSIIDRLIHSSSHSSISFSPLDTRYLLAMIILNSLSSLGKYSIFLQQTWKSLMRETNGMKQVVIAYTKHWEKVWKNETTIEDIDAMVKCLNEEYELVGKIMQTMEQNQFEQWMKKTIEHIKIPLEDMENGRKGLEVLQTLAHCSLNKEKNLYLMTTINSVVTQCGLLLIHLSNEHPGYGEMVSVVLTFANEILIVKKSQLRSQVAISLLQCCLHLSPTVVLFANHSNICKLISLLIKHHPTTLCKHVPTIETMIKLLLQSIVWQGKGKQDANEELIEAARDMTKLAAHLVEQCKEDFRSTIVYVIIDYVHLLSKGVFLSSILKKTLNNVIFEFFRISGDRVEQYSGQMSVAERELLKQLYQEFKQYHMFKGTV